MMMINIGVNGGFNGFGSRKKYIKKLIDIMMIKACIVQPEDTSIGRYKLSDSAMKDTNYVKKHANIKAKFEGDDDE